MGIWSRFVRHMELISTMFARTGAVGGLAEQGNEHSVRQAIMRCQACGHGEDCARFLEHAEQGCEPPAYCNNATLIRNLQQVNRAA